MGPDPLADIWLLLPRPKGVRIPALSSLVLRLPPSGVNYLIKGTSTYTVFTSSLKRLLLVSKPKCTGRLVLHAPHKWPRTLLRASSRWGSLSPATRMELPPLSETDVIGLDRHIHAQKPQGLSSGVSGTTSQHTPHKSGSVHCPQQLRKGMFQSFMRMADKRKYFLVLRKRRKPTNCTPAP